MWREWWRVSDRRDLRDRLEALENRFGLDADNALYVVNASPVLDDGMAPYSITEEWDDDPLIDRTERVELPVFKPTTVQSGIQCFDGEDVRRLWEIQPEDVREQELEYRIEHGLPIPPVLQQ